MYRRFSMMLFISLFVFVLSACNPEESSVTSNTSITSNIATSNVSVTSNANDKSSVSDTTSNADIFKIIDGVYYGNSIRFTVPNGYTLYKDEENAVFLLDTTHTRMIYTSTTATDLTIEDLTQSNIANFIDSNTSVVSFEKITFSGIDGVRLIYKSTSETSSGEASVSSNVIPHTIYQYTTIYKSKIITVAFYTEDIDINAVISQVINSVVLD